MMDNLENIIEQSIDSSKEHMNEWADAIEPLVDSSGEHIQNWEDTVEPLVEKIVPQKMDWEAIKNDSLESGAWGSGAGVVVGATAGGVGAVPGGIIGGTYGAAVGAIGEATRQTLVNYGYSEYLAQGVETGINLIGPAGGGKILLKEGGEQLVKHGDVASVIRNQSDEILSKTKGFVDDAKEYVGDKLKTVEYESKGIMNNLKEHQFYDAKGTSIGAFKINDVIDTTRTIKMPYIGSDALNSNSAGFLRDNSFFGKNYLEKYPETLSANNIERIKNGLSPMVDKKWVAFNPNHKSFIGETLEHHHISNTNITGYIPQTLHRGKINKEAMHVA